MPDLETPLHDPPDCLRALLSAAWDPAMTSSSAATQLGRQFWSSTIREGLGGFIWRLPTRQQPPNRWGPGRFAYQSPPWTSAARVGASRPFSSSPKISRYNVRRSCTSGGLLLLGLSSPSLHHTHGSGNMRGRRRHLHRHEYRPAVHDHTVGCASMETESSHRKARRQAGTQPKK